MFLFTDNEARASILNSQRIMPGALFVTISTLDGDSLVQCPMFITGVSISRTAKVQIEQTLDLKHHCIGFGEHPADIEVSGLAVLPSQGVPSRGRKGEGTSVHDVADLTSARLYSMGVEAARSAPVTPSPEAEGSDEENNLFDTFMSKLEEAGKEINDKVGDLRTAMLDVSKAVSSVLGGIAAVVGVIASAKDNAYQMLYKALGMPLSGGEALAEFASDRDYRLGTTLNLHTFFHAYNAGYFTGDQEILVTASGVSFSARLIGLKMSSDSQTGPFYKFSMSFKALSTQDKEIIVAGDNFAGTVASGSYDNSTATYVDLNEGNNLFSSLLMTGLDVGFEIGNTKSPVLF